ncbi:uncharacterized protein LOC127867271 isoform X2 [Dreissena polymorpha]|uniref:uncharacterized protein LOC127867271 isoform X2 n=1 Tax=Dreissena polymorpha TaxID=45954 RepID=UPI002264DC7C|nr:uncharacterized protein LOC127867271 isoform X2 [Dreissena polymorpha]
MISTSMHLVWIICSSRLAMDLVQSYEVPVYCTVTSHPERQIELYIRTNQTFECTISRPNASSEVIECISRAKDCTDTGKEHLSDKYFSNRTSTHTTLIIRNETNNFNVSCYNPYNISGTRTHLEIPFGCNTTKSDCADGTFGVACDGRCYCVDGVACEKDTGECPAGGCSPGYKGPQCDTECNDGKYGDACLQDCGSCANVDVCDHVTGRCPNGCSDGWLTDTCQTDASERGLTQSEIAGIIIGCICIVSIPILIVMIWKRREKCPCFEARNEQIPLEGRVTSDPSEESKRLLQTANPVQDNTNTLHEVSTNENEANGVNDGVFILHATDDENIARTIKEKIERELGSNDKQLVDVSADVGLGEGKLSYIENVLITYRWILFLETPHSQTDSIHLQNGETVKVDNLYAQNNDDKPRFIPMLSNIKQRELKRSWLKALIPLHDSEHDIKNFVKTIRGVQ